MESNILSTKWSIMAQKMTTQQIQTPQGIQYIQQPVNIPLFFRNTEEVKRFIEEQKEAEQIVLSRQSYWEGENINYYYNEKGEKQ